MKQFYLLLAVTVLLVGCSAEDHDLLVKPAPAAVAPAVDLLTATTPAPVASAANPLAAAPEGNESTEEEVPLLTDGDQRAKLADLTEKVYLKWNAALAEFKKQHNRLPSTLEELRKAQPALAAHRAPRGFKLQYDKQGGEIYVVHATKHRPANVANSQVAGFPPPPVLR